jgi:hypothetical protein
MVQISHLQKFFFITINGKTEPLCCVQMLNRLHHTLTHICKHLRSQGIDSAKLGIDSGATKRFTNTGSGVLYSLYSV